MVFSEILNISLIDNLYAWFFLIFGLSYSVNYLISWRKDAYLVCFSKFEKRSQTLKQYILVYALDMLVISSTLTFMIYFK
jgi:hypothetical protein